MPSVDVYAAPSGIVTAKSGIVTDPSGISPESVTINRIDRSRSAGLVGHDRPDSPVTLRRNTHQAKLAGYLTQLLAGNPGAEDKQNYEEGLERQRSLAARFAVLDRTQQHTHEDIIFLQLKEDALR